MNICLIGYGRMGHEIEAAAANRGHRIVMVIDKDNLIDFGRIDPGKQMLLLSSQLLKLLLTILQSASGRRFRLSVEQPDGLRITRKHLLYALKMRPRSFTLPISA